MDKQMGSSDKLYFFMRASKTADGEIYFILEFFGHMHRMNEIM